MPTRELLSPAQRAQFLNFPAERGEQLLARFYTLSSDQAAFVMLFKALLKQYTRTTVAIAYFRKNLRVTSGLLSLFSIVKNRLRCND